MAQNEGPEPTRLISLGTPREDFDLKIRDDSSLKSRGDSKPLREDSELKIDDDVRINDLEFMKDLKRLRQLRSFLIQEAININTGETNELAFGRLNLLQFDYRGRAPTQDEWTQVELHTQTLFASLTDPLRKRFILGEIPLWASVLPILLAVVALLALIGAIAIQARDW